jgi:transposase-like protein
MSKHRRTWSLAEKLEALQLLKKEGVGKASRQLEISSTTLYKWQTLFEEHGDQGLNHKPIADKNSERLQRENRELKIRTADAVGGRKGTDY